MTPGGARYDPNRRRGRDGNRDRGAVATATRQPEEDDTANGSTELASAAHGSRVADGRGDGA